MNDINMIIIDNINNDANTINNKIIIIPSSSSPFHLRVREPIATVWQYDIVAMRHCGKGECQAARCNWRTLLARCACPNGALPQVHGIRLCNNAALTHGRIATLRQSAPVPEEKQKKA